MSSVIKLNINDLKKLIENITNQVRFNDKIFYHGRKVGRRPYNGNYIFITESMEYAAGYSDGKTVHQYKIPFSEDKIFSIKNQKHIQILKTITDQQGFKNIFLSAANGGEMDWTSLQYIYTDDLDGEEVLQSLGFYGVKLNERPEVYSIMIFDQTKINKVGEVDLSSKQNSNKVNKYINDFQTKYNLL